MTIDELLNELRELSREWKIEADSRRFRNTIDRFTQELDEVIQRATVKPEPAPEKP